MTEIMSSIRWSKNKKYSASGRCQKGLVKIIENSNWPQTNLDKNMSGKTSFYCKSYHENCKSQQSSSQFSLSKIQIREYNW